MQLIMLKSKLHMARVTDAQLDYHGSLTIDENLMDAVGLLAHEKILVANVENGNRFETYAIPGARGSGMICLNGATAHKGVKGDRVIIFSFAVMSPDEAKTYKPVVLCLDAQNKPTEFF
jgi:aspartate 1-decarboxylase